jgi:uncharacterized membrane protein
MSQNDTPIASDRHPGRMRGIVFSIIALLALIGLTDASFLTVSHLVGEDAVCGASAGCSIVLSSRYASVAGVPTAAVGIAAYFAVFGLAVFIAFGHDRLRRLLATLIITMFLVSLGFLYLQAFVLHAFCPFCLVSAALTFFLTGLLLVTPEVE